MVEFLKVALLSHIFRKAGQEKGYTPYPILPLYGPLQLLAKVYPAASAA